MKRSKPLVLALCAILLVVGTILGTVAYLQDTASVVNTFTVGNVHLKLDEAVVDEKGEPTGGRTETGNAYHLLPGETYTKDPTVTVLKGSEESYVRMVVTLNKATALKEIFTDLQAKYPDDFASGFLPQEHTGDTWNSEKWPCFSMAEDTENDTFVLEFRYPETVTPAQDEDLELEPLFEKIVIPGQLNNDHLAKLEGFTIDVQGHAIQALGFDTADDAWAAFDAQTEAESGVVTP